MATHRNATAFEEELYATKSTTITVSDAVRRRAQSVINDRSIDPRWRAVIRYGLETNDPWLPDLVRRADARETIIDTLDFSLTPETVEDDPDEGKIEALAQMICRAGQESATAMLVLMGTLENSAQPKVLANIAKHFAFTHCGELNVNGMVDTQIAMLQVELFARDPA